MAILRRGSDGRALPVYPSLAARREAKNARRRARRAERNFPRLWIDHLVIHGPDECWTWDGFHNEHGYPQAKVGGRPHGVHRLVAEVVWGPLEGPVHHVCENPGCANPNHLQPLATKELHEALHAELRRKTRCIRGHDLTDPMNVTELRSGERRCRVCHAERERERGRRNRERR